MAASLQGGKCFLKPTTKDKLHAKISSHAHSGTLDLVDVEHGPVQQLVASSQTHFIIVIYSTSDHAW